MPGIVLHNEDEGPPALLADWLEERGIDFDVVRVWEAGVPDDPTDFDWVVALGAESSVNDGTPEWIPAEIDLLRRAVAREVPVLGICFGGQALSVALGGEVGPANPVSIGWYEIDTGEPDLVPPGPWLHFNFESFSVPADAIQIARSPCGPGAFRVGPHLGVQFHPEVTPEIVNEWADKSGGRLDRLGFDAGQIRADNRRFASAAAKHAHAMFDAWRKLAADPGRQQRKGPATAQC